MKPFTKFVHFVDWVFTLVVALLFFWWLAQYPPFLSSLATRLTAAARTSDTVIISTLIAFAAIILLNLIYILVALRALLAASDRGLGLERPEGNVVVKASAVESVLAQVLRTSPQIEQAKINVKGGRREKSRTVVTARVRMSEALDIPAAVRETQAVLKSRFEELFGPQRPVSINIVVTRLGKKLPAESEPPQDEVIRPRYTVEEEED